jgi:leucine efflux protein
MAMTVAALAFLCCRVADLLTRFPARRLRAHPVVSRSLEMLAGLFSIDFGIKLVVTHSPLRVRREVAR